MTRYSWWSYVRSMVCKYPEREKRIVSQGLADTPAEIGRNPGKISRPTEEEALKRIAGVGYQEKKPTVEEREFEAVRDAIDRVRRWKNGEETLKIIKYVYWDRTKTIQGAAEAVGYSYVQAKRMHGQFLREVAKSFGILE